MHGGEWAKDAAGKPSIDLSPCKNQQKYLNKYGVHLKIPSTIVQGCQFYPRDPKYCVQLVNYRIPGHDEEKCKSDEDNKMPDHKVDLYDETGR